MRRIPRLLRRALLLSVVAAVSLTVYDSWSAGSLGAGGWTRTETGPLGPADRDLLVKVRLASLWELPTGQQAQQMASSAEVREVGRHLAEEHGQLDVEVRRVAEDLGVPLPSSPNGQQIAWMDEITNKVGSEYDRVFVQRLREAHGTILPAIAEVRASTRNEEIRAFAAVADEFVTRHIGYLEGTGLVDFDALPDAPSPGLLSAFRGPSDLIGPIAVFAGLLLGATALVAALRRRSARPDPDRRPARALLTAGGEDDTEPAASPAVARTRAARAVLGASSRPGAEPPPGPPGRTGRYPVPDDDPTLGAEVDPDPAPDIPAPRRGGRHALRP